MLPRPRFGIVLDWLFRIVVAVVFLAAAVPKIFDPLTFAKAITNYRLSLPWIGLNYTYPVALFMPALEAVVAIALFWNRSKKAASVFAGGLLLLFIVLIGQAVLRGLNIDCGCFGSTDIALIGAQKVGYAKIIEDALLLGMCIYVILLPDRLSDRQLPIRSRVTSTENEAES